MGSLRSTILQQQANINFRSREGQQINIDHVYLLPVKKKNHFFPCMRSFKSSRFNNPTLSRVSRWVLTIRNPRLAQSQYVKQPTRKCKEQFLVDLVPCESLSHLSIVSMGQGRFTPVSFARKRSQNGSNSQRSLDSHVPYIKVSTVICYRYKLL